MNYMNFGAYISLFFYRENLKSRKPPETVVLEKTLINSWMNLEIETKNQSRLSIKFLLMLRQCDDDKPGANTQTTKHNDAV